MSSICQNKFILLLILMLSMMKESDTSHFINWEHDYEIAQNFSEALTEIINKRFVEKSQRRVFNFQIEIEPRNQKFSYMFHRIVENTGQLLKNRISIRLYNGLPIPVDNERHFSVILVDTAKSLEFLYKDLNKYHLFMEGSFFIILLTFPNIHHYYDELFEILQLNWRHGFTHVDVLIYELDNSILMFHSMPFTRFHCKGVAPIIHNKFTNGRWSHQQFFIAKSTNLFGCPLVCATWEDLPYFKVSGKSVKGKTVYDGLEGKMLEYLSAKMNFTIAIRWLNDEEINQTIYDVDGVFNKLFSSGTDFVIGAFSYKPTTLKDPYAPTTIYYLSDFHFIVSSRTGRYDPFTKLLLPFQTDIWIILIFIFIFGNTAVFTVTCLDHKVKYFILGYGNKTPSYNMVVISLGGAVTKDPKIPFSRFLLMLWLLATFILRSVYQGFMFHFIRSDLHKPPPKCINDLLGSEYRILVSEVVYSSISNLPLLYEKAEILNVSEVEAFEMLRHPRDYKPYKLAILTAHEYFGYYRFITPINQDFYVVPEKLFTQPLSIFMKKNSPHINRISLYIKNYINEGHMQRWERFLVFKNTFRKSRNESPKPMKLKHLVAVFYLLLIGLAVSLFVFVAEIFISITKKIYKCVKRKHDKTMKKRRHRFVL